MAQTVSLGKRRGKSPSERLLRGNKYRGDGRDSSSANSSLQGLTRTRANRSTQRKLAQHMSKAAEHLAKSGSLNDVPLKDGPRISIEIPITPRRLRPITTLRNDPLTPTSVRRSNRLLQLRRSEDGDDDIDMSDVLPTPLTRGSGHERKDRRVVKFADLIQIQPFDTTNQPSVTTKTTTLPVVSSFVSDRLSYLRNADVFRSNIQFRVPRLDCPPIDVCASDFESLAELLKDVLGSAHTVCAPFQVRYMLHPDRIPEGYDQAEDLKRYRIGSKRSEEAFGEFVDRCRGAVWPRFKRWRAEYGDNLRGSTGYDERDLNSACRVTAVVELFWKKGQCQSGD